MTPRILVGEILETKRLILRARRFDDNALVFEASRYPGFNDGMLWDPPEKAEALVDRYHASVEAWVAGQSYSFTILEKRRRDRPVGMLSIRRTDEPAVWMLGYWVHPAHQGSGFMTEAVGVATRFAFERLEANEVCACYAQWNVASERVLEKNHFTKQPEGGPGFEKNGTWTLENRMTLDRSSWLHLMDPTSPTKGGLRHLWQGTKARPWTMVTTVVTTSLAGTTLFNMGHPMLLGLMQISLGMSQIVSYYEGRNHTTIGSVGRSALVVGSICVLVGVWIISSAAHL